MCESFTVPDGLKFTSENRKTISMDAMNALLTLQGRSAAIDEQRKKLDAALEQMRSNSETSIE